MRRKNAKKSPGNRAAHHLLHFFAQLRDGAARPKGEQLRVAEREHECLVGLHGVGEWGRELAAKQLQQRLLFFKLFF
jgi:hypothetical protein